MRIALFTYYNVNNYGAVLQSYATIKALKKYGHEVELINIRIPESPSSIFKKILLYPKFLKFERFRKKYFEKVSIRYDSIGSIQANPPIADCYLVGSDQTWNPDLSKDKAKVFFLDFKCENVVKASYASSFGVSRWGDTQWINKEEVKRLLQDFQIVSVRELSGLKILEDVFEVSNASLVLDPVMLFDDYTELTGNVKRNGEIILYKFVYSDRFYEQCRNIGKILSLPIRSIGSIRRIKGMRCSYPETIENWIRRIAGAEFVVTDSFHGTVLSILYKKQFIVYKGNYRRMTRLESLLNMLNLSNRLVQEGDSLEDVVKRLRCPIDYVSVHYKILELRGFSQNVLRSLDRGNR